MGIREGEERDKARNNMESNNEQKLLQINDRHQTTDPGMSENTKQNKCKKKKKTTPKHIIFRLHKIKDKEKILKEDKGKKYLTNREAKIRITPDFSQEPCRQEDSGVKYLKC